MIAVRRLATALLGLAAACSPQQTPGGEVLACPDQQAFTTSVSAYMERRCGTLDCHGSPARPMRLYGQYGLRHPDEANWSGGFATTHREREENYVAVCGVEQNTTARDGGAAGALVVTKARGVGHKGGKIMSQGSLEDVCLAGWFRGDRNVTDACKKALKGLSPH